MDDIIYTSAKSIAQAIRDKKVSSAEVVEAHLKRIAEVNPKLNAVVQLAEDRARVEAKDADDALARGDENGLLHGVPITIKDNLDTEGIISTGGTQGRKNFVPKHDATAVARLRKAGAILLGKTNTPELTLSFETDNVVYGRTSNPYDLSRMSGGSSGGAAAIIAAGGAPLDIGSDTGGSIRLPAHFCGIAGIRPTSGRVPRTGHIIPPGGASDFLTQLGPMSRFVEDLSYTLPIISGPDWRDANVIPMPLGNPDDVDLKGLRVALLTDNGIRAPIAEIKKAVEDSAKSLEAAGAVVTEARPTGIERTMELSEGIFGAGFGDAGGRASAIRLLEEYGTTESPRLEKDPNDSKPLTVKEVGDILFEWDEFKSDMLSFMENYDIILGPVNAGVALPHGGLNDENHPDFSYTFTHNFTGWPGAVVRVAASNEGLPIGVQVNARPWREDVALAVAQHLESAFGGWQKPPI